MAEEVARNDPEFDHAEPDEEVMGSVDGHDAGVDEVDNMVGSDAGANEDENMAGSDAAWLAERYGPLCFHRLTLMVVRDLELQECYGLVLRTLADENAARFRAEFINNRREEMELNAARDEKLRFAEHDVRTMIACKELVQPDSSNADKDLMKPTINQQMVKAFVQLRDDSDALEKLAVKKLAEKK
ncbi:hypothetical protein H2200_012994 [Cladophialophora chaetospira]|uniref:Uncharacterized protein n=1 Tax=Cladophialophora chaetospira TaxID=386627 RepID=A0AA39CBP7_9EURO|nr:hypothetical protein H2200_012994 [Cladophialophora chaetospira]